MIPSPHPLAGDTVQRRKLRSGTRLSPAGQTALIITLAWLASLYFIIRMGA